MATIYSVGETFENDQTLLERMSHQRNDLGKPVYTLASGISLMLFYAFAMQCMSTLAVVRRETKSWKWPLIQLVYMTALAYISALIAFNLLNWWYKYLSFSCYWSPQSFIWPTNSSLKGGQITKKAVRNVGPQEKPLGIPSSSDHWLQLVRSELPISRDAMAVGSGVFLLSVLTITNHAL